MRMRFDWKHALVLTAVILLLTGCQNPAPEANPTPPPTTAPSDAAGSLDEIEATSAAALLPYTGGGQIAFDGGDGVYLLDVAAVLETGSDQRELWIPDAFAASWSPDGSQIAYASVPNSQGMAIYVMDVGTGETRRITEEGFWPTWSPDGTRIAFLAGNRNNFDIYVIDADGSNLQQVTNLPGMDNQPAWSPNGNQIAFSSDHEGDTDIYLIDFDSGDDPVNLTNSPGVDGAPDWSPDGSQITFYSSRDGGRENIFIMDADGGNVIQVTDSVYDDWHPAWSPDGHMIAFTSYRSYGAGDAELFVIDLRGGMEAEGNTPQQLTFSPIHDENATWHPNSSSVSYLSGAIRLSKVSSRLSSLRKV